MIFLISNLFINNVGMLYLEIINYTDLVYLLVYQIMTVNSEKWRVKRDRYGVKILYSVAYFFSC